MYSTAICGAGIAGISTAYYLLQKEPQTKVVIIDKLQPLSFTTSKSGENFRDYWPQPFMKDFVSQSIRLMEALRNQYGADSFDIQYSGYHFISHKTDETIFGTEDQTAQSQLLEEINDEALIQRDFSYLSSETKKIVRIKNAGNVDVYGMGSLMLSEAKKLGLTFIQAEVTGITRNNGEFQIQLDNHEAVNANRLVIATGPFLNHIANMLGIEFPIENIFQQKFIIPDPAQIIPQDMPFTIFADTQYLDWSEAEKEQFAADEDYAWLLNKFPGGLHIRPTGSGLKFGWAYNTKAETPSWEVPKSDFFSQLVLKGASRFIPALSEYYNNTPTPLITYSGYYTRTRENWALIGPTDLDKVYVVGALAGYGTMSACAAGELCVKYLVNDNHLPDYAPYFHPLRYKDPEMLATMRSLNMDGQL